MSNKEKITIKNFNLQKPIKIRKDRFLLNQKKRRNFKNISQLEKESPTITTILTILIKLRILISFTRISQTNSSIKSLLRKITKERIL